jgi:hypothetical protein
MLLVPTGRAILRPSGLTAISPELVLDSLITAGPFALCSIHLELTLTVSAASDPICAAVFKMSLLHTSSNWVSSS